MANIIATRGHPETCKIDWSRCNPEKLRDTFLLRQAYSMTEIKTLADLMEYVNETDFLSHLGSIKTNALLEINRCLPPCARPRIYYEVLGRYYMLEFQPENRDILYGALPVSANLISTWSEFEESIPEFTTWEYTSIKSIH